MLGLSLSWVDLPFEAVDEYDTTRVCWYIDSWYMCGWSLWNQGTAYSCFLYVGGVCDKVAYFAVTDSTHTYGRTQE